METIFEQSAILSLTQIIIEVIFVVRRFDSRAIPPTQFPKQEMELIVHTAFA
jgi:hypothetical protein